MTNHDHELASTWVFAGVPEVAGIADAPTVRSPTATVAAMSAFTTLLPEMSSWTNRSVDTRPKI